MIKVSRIINPYSLLIFGVFIEYFPAYYDGKKFSISVGRVDLYITDVALIVLLVWAFLNFLSGSRVLFVIIKNNGVEVRIIFGLIIAFLLFKWFLQSPITITSIRILLTYITAYLFLFFFPVIIKRNSQLKSLITPGFARFLVIFSCCISMRSQRRATSCISYQGTF